MFREAYAIASQFTWPVVVSRKDTAGKCSCSIGSCVVVNDQGWILTAFHLAQQYAKVVDADATERIRESRAGAIRSDTSISEKDRREKLRALGKPGSADTVRGSGFWGRSGTQLVAWWGIESADIAVGQLKPFDPTWVTTYPTFKDPTKDFEPGASLCKLGYPFHHFTPTWDDKTDGFELPPGSLPMPRFPMDGILTRIANLEPPPGPRPSYPLRWVETSTPGLKGQSGGPIFDPKGSVWAIQVQTAHYPLGFDPAAPKTNQKEHQFLNVGLGVHPDTLFGLMNEQGVKFSVSPY